MRARHVFLALLIIIVGMAITASRKGVVADWSRSIADLDDLTMFARAREAAREAGLNFGDTWQEVERFTREMPTEGATALEIENPNGQVIIEGVVRRGQEVMSADAMARVEGQAKDDEPPALVIEAIRYGRGDTTEEAAENARRARLEISRSGQTLSVKVAGTEHFARRARLDLHITAPPALDVGIAVASGDVQVQGMTRGVEVATASGDVSITGAGRAKVTGASGDVSIVSADRAEVNTASGDVKLREIRGPVQCRVISGDLTMEDITGVVRISAVSGDIRARGVRGDFSTSTISGSLTLRDYAGSDVTLKTTSGDLETSFVEPLTGTVSARSISGDVAVAIPAGSDCAVDLASTSGEIRVRVPMREISRSRRHVSGVIGNGRGRLELSSVSGSLEVKEAESAPPPAAAIEEPGRATPPSGDAAPERIPARPISPQR